jgi:hypothetical protein
MAMSCMTNAVFSSCDLWSAFNKLAAYNIRQDKGLSMIEKSHLAVKSLWGKFQELKETDFDKKFKEYQKANKYANAEDIFKAVMKDINLSLDSNLKILDTEEKKILKKEMAKSGGKPNKNR